MKLAVFSQPARRMAFGLVQILRIRMCRRLRLVVPFIDEGCATILYAVSVWGIVPQRHENYGMIATQSEIHATLKASALSAAHFEIGDNVIAQGVFCFTY
jgi:hypothetical protein